MRLEVVEQQLYDTYMNVVDGTEQLQYVLHRPSRTRFCELLCTNMVIKFIVYIYWIQEQYENSWEMQNVFLGCSARVYVFNSS